MKKPSPGIRPPPFQPVAGVLAWVFPGLGHFYLGYTRRAVLICAGVLGLFAAGLFIGGIDCVDRKSQFFWFLGQSLNGPIALGVDYVHQNHFKALDPQSVTNLRRDSIVIAKADLSRALRRSARPDEKRVIQSIEIKDSATKQTHTLSVPTFAPAGPGEYPPNIKGLGRVNELGTLFCTIAGFLNLICIFDAAQNWRRGQEPKPASAAGIANVGSGSVRAATAAGGGGVTA